MRSQFATNSYWGQIGVMRPYVVADAVATRSRVELLTEIDRTEVLEFLNERPVHTVVMTSLIQDNGLESPRNRGSFHGFRNAAGDLEGVALIGHTTLVETRSQEALRALAHTARRSDIEIHLMMSDGDSIETFWSHYSADQRQPRLVCTERLFEMKSPVLVREPVEGLRLATEDELLPIAIAHANIAEEESEVNPMLKDYDGFLERVRRRIQQGRVWVVFDGDKLVFKADVVAETSSVKYLEGVYVAPDLRGAGIGPNCLSQLSRTLLAEARYVCLLSNVEQRRAHRAFVKAGFSSKDECVTIFL